MSETKAPLWKQILGAVGGAAVAFVVYQAYTFTSGHVQAWLNPPTFTGPSEAGYKSGGGEPVWPTGTFGFPSTVLSSSSSSSLSSIGRVELGPYGSIKAAKKISPSYGVAAAVSSTSSSVSSAAVAAVSSSSASAASSSVSSRTRVRTHAAPIEQQPVYETPVEENLMEAVDYTPEVTRAHALPNSGFGLELVAISAVGAMIGRKKFLR